MYSWSNLRHQFLPRHLRVTCANHCSILPYSKMVASFNMNHPNGTGGQWRIQDFEWGPGAVTRLKCEHDKWCDREAITRGRSPRISRGVRGHALAFLGESGGMLPRKILKIEMLRYAFSALLGVFLSLNKGSKLLSWIVAKLKTPTVCYGWVGLFYVCENPPTFYERHTGWAWLSRRTPLRAYLFFEVFPSYGARNVNDVEEFQRRWNPFSFYPFWNLSLHSTRARPGWFENARRLIDGLVEKEIYWSEFARSKTG